MRLIAKILLSVYCIGLAAPFSAWVNYYSNLDFIKEVLCLNRKEPITTCNGSCYLRIQLQDFYDEQKSGESPTPSKQKVSWELNLYAIPDNHLNLDKIDQAQKAVIYIIKDYHYPFYKVFHPPQLV